MPGNFFSGRFTGGIIINAQSVEPLKEKLHAQPTYSYKLCIYFAGYKAWVMGSACIIAPVILFFLNKRNEESFPTAFFLSSQQTSS